MTYVAKDLACKVWIKWESMPILKVKINTVENDDIDCLMWFERVKQFCLWVCKKSCL